MSAVNASDKRTVTGVHRYPGVQPFGDDEVEYRLFRGRDREKYELLQLVLAERLVLMFGRSGLGKSSLINAGLLAPLRSKEFFPMVVRVAGSGGNPLANLYDGIRVAVGSALARYGIECQPGESQWNRTSLWHFFKTIELWRNDRLLTPVLILDQFEELFTLYSADERKDFVRELSHVIRGIRPKRSEQSAFLSERPPELKVVLVMREDFYANLEELRDQIPGIYRAPLRLNALSRDQAQRAIVEPAQLEGEEFSTPPFTWGDETLRDVLDFLCLRQLGDGRTETGTDVEPFQLQLICQHVEQKVLTEGLTEITPQALGGRSEMERVLSDFYERSLDQICARFRSDKGLRQRLERLCEYGFVTARGRRLLREESTILHDDKVSPEVLQEMVQLRLLRKEPRVGDNYYELTHDTLIEPIQASRQRRETVQRTARKRRMLVSAASSAALVVAVIAAILYLQKAEFELQQVAVQANKTELQGQVKAAEKRVAAAEKQAKAAKIVAQTLEAVIENSDVQSATSRMVDNALPADDAEQQQATSDVAKQQVQAAKAEAIQLEREAELLLTQADTERVTAQDQADSLRKQAGLNLDLGLAELERKVDDNSVNLRGLEAAYRAFLDTHQKALDADDRTRLADAADRFKTSADQFEGMLAQLEQSNLTACERYDLWASYTPVRTAGPEANRKAAFIEGYENSSVVVNAMVTASAIKNREAVNVKAIFKPGSKVWVHAALGSHVGSAVFFQWVDADGNAVPGKSSSRVVNLPAGSLSYRTYDAKSIGTPGVYFVRLYAKERGRDVLVCRRRFEIEGKFPNALTVEAQQSATALFQGANIEENRETSKNLTADSSVTAASPELSSDTFAGSDAQQSAADTVILQMQQAKAEAARLEREAQVLLTQADTERVTAQNQADSLRKRAGLNLDLGLAELERKVDDNNISLRELEAAYRAFLNTHQKALAADDRTRLADAADQFKTSADQFESILTQLQQSDLSACERFDLWTSYTPVRTAGPEAKRKAAFIARYENASVVVNAMVTASAVENREAVNVKSIFKPGSRIWVHAALGSPAGSAVFFRWVDADGHGLPGKSSSRVVNLPAGSLRYRTYDVKNISAPGAYSALLYAKERGRDVLVCRRRFDVRA